MESIKELEKGKTSHGKVTIVGLGRLGLRVALNLMETHRGGPELIKAIDGQRITADDLIFRLKGARVGEYKVKFLERLATGLSTRKVVGIPVYISDDNLHLIDGDIICISIAGGDTLPITASIIKHAHRIGAATISTMGVAGIGGEKVITEDISQAKDNPITKFLKDKGIKDHTLIGTGKLIRDWEPITGYVLDEIAKAITSHILKILHMG
ncbi:MAG TPA: hypothetical protein GXX31_07075 [Methanothermobacter sp.]|uniref:THIF-type NAD/FAD binding fold domain-containing protein n=1 Tax=Methanothermobacter tenebrarum TaxID=680118 RepID=A0ABM7YC63_9EURY|nr:hypothetical protein [Methanothermobacter tenebrarum]MDI6882266.1 hypothetical protein [Methanothermobacter sp.]MDX9693717.1 hypothetical protein [Methanothermobacter sp.]BDH78896.1 hypothetical protein MTTB_02750 [Methanothermobacter tenebrarum]HHW17104.1 hypothetical protein [Methanothermobacter sp.]HOQ20526.1 hypothetical protein [Methanothermobacter sp.]